VTRDDRPAATSAGPSTALWRNGDFRLLIGGRVVSQVGDQLQFLAVPLLVLALTGSAAQAGIVLGLQTVVTLAFGLVAGALADRWDRKRTMIACEIGRAVVTASVPIAAALGVLAMPQLYLVAVVNGVLGTLFGAANSSALPNVVRAEQLPGALGAFGSIGSALRIVGAPLAGIAYSLGRAVPFGVNAVSFLVSAATLGAIRTTFQQRRDRPVAGARSLVAEIREGLGWLAGRPVIRTLALLDAGDSLRFGAGYLLIIVLATRLHAGPTEVGLVFAGAAVGALVGSLAAARLARRVPLGRLSITMLWIEAVVFPVYALAPTWWLLLLVALAESVVTPIYTVALDTYRLGITPDALRGRVTSAVDTLTTGASALGALCSGLLIEALGPVALTLALAGLLAVLATVATCNGVVRRAPLATAAAD
jgi:MFS family permease